MTTADLLTALALPNTCRVDRRLAKTMLADHGATRANDRKALLDGVESAHWLASLKPTTVAIPEHRSESRHYVESVVLHVALRPEAKAQRLVHLLHAALPHPALLLTSGAGTSLSLCHKRLAQNRLTQAGATARVVDGPLAEVRWPTEQTTEPYAAEFAAALGLGPRHPQELPPTDLAALYQRWIEAVQALQAARRTARFALAATAEQAERRRMALAECDRLEAEMARIRAAAGRERQMVRLAALNHTLQAARVAHSQALLAL
jgi:hypothetical protein